MQKSQIRKRRESLWNYGRQCRINNTKRIQIKLPAKENENGEYIPDFEYMEKYIKSLPFGDII